MRPQSQEPDRARHRRPRDALAVAIAALLGLALAVGCGSDDEAAGGVTTSDAPALRPGQLAGRGDPLPALELAAHDGTTVELSSLPAPAVINFFASWCASCVQEMPAFESVHQDLGDEVAFLGIAATDNLDDEQALIERTGITYPTARDPQGEAMTALGVLGLPVTVLVGPDGTVEEYHIGALDPEELRSLIDEHLRS